MKKEKNTQNYHDYLKIDSLLQSQVLLSEKNGKKAHDEMLFIVIHQIYDSILYVSAIILFAVLIHIGQGLLDMWSPTVATTQKVVVYLNVLWYLLISNNIINQNKQLKKI